MRGSGRLLEVDSLSVGFDTPNGVLRAADDVSFSLDEGETLGIVGESGSGKSVTAQTILRLLPSPPARILAGQVRFRGTDLLQVPDRDMRRVRGAEIGFIGQEPARALNPLLTIGRQLTEAIEAHDSGVSRRQLRGRAIELLEQVKIPDPSARLGEYPHQFSGGMAQRVVIAMAIANRPRVLIADEPTTALDVTVQAQVLRSLRAAQEATGAATILITHDLAVVAEFAHRLVVMYGGRVVETGAVSSVFERPAHPYTAGLLASVPRLDVRSGRLATIRGTPPRLDQLPEGCAFRPRCDLHQGRDRCVEVRPELREVAGGRRAACHFAEECLSGPR